jgi:hypothetical protein
MPDEIVGYANPDNAEYMEIRLATQRGVRRTKVRKKQFTKRFSKLKRKEETYARKVKVYNRLTARTTTKPVINRKEYIYNPEVKAYEKYSPDDRMTIKTDDGERNVSQEQFKYLYKRRGGIYKKVNDTERVIYDKPRREPERRGNKIARSFQIAISRTVVIDGKTHHAIGYSKVQCGDYSDEEMREQARRHLKATVMDLGGKYDYSNVEFTTDEHEEYVKWVYGNGNR